jgi:hypothetical protein
MRTSRAEAWLVISAAGCFLGYLVLTWALEQRRFAAECAELGIDRMVQRPSDDDLRRMVDDCERGRRRR